MTEWKEFDGLSHQLGEVDSTIKNYLPPSSFAITSALSSDVVYAIELLEFPKEIPMAWRSEGVVPFVAAVSEDMISLVWIIEKR